MIDKNLLEDILFLDIETVPESDDFQNDEVTKLLWEEKTISKKRRLYSRGFYERAGIWAEFGKIICISVGYFNINNDLKKFRVTSFYGKEKQILLDFKNLMQSHFNQPKHKLCGHNSKEFDIPFIARRMIINNIQLPDKLNLFGKKPWEIPIHTMDLCSFEIKHSTL